MKPSDIIEPDEVISAATLIIQYCIDDDERIGCANCVFANLSKPYGERCGLADLPQQWDVLMFRENAAYRGLHISKEFRGRLKHGEV